MAKTIRSIHFLNDRVIVDYGEHKEFQFCKSCKDGKHFKAFLNFFASETQLKEMDQTTAIQSEKRFYYLLSRGSARRLVNREAHIFVEHLQGRQERMKK